MTEIDIQKVTPDLFLRVAENKAEELKRNGTSSTQVRKFYDEVCKLEDALNVCKKGEQDEKFKKVQLALCMLVPKAEYARARKGVDVCSCFVDIIRKCVEQVRNRDDIRNFRLFLEAIVAYSKKVENPEKKVFKK